MQAFLPAAGWQTPALLAVTSLPCLSKAVPDTRAHPSAISTPRFGLQHVPFMSQMQPEYSQIPA